MTGVVALTRDQIVLAGWSGKTDLQLTEQEFLARCFYRWLNSHHGRRAIAVKEFKSWWWDGTPYIEAVYDDGWWAWGIEALNEEFNSEPFRNFHERSKRSLEDDRKELEDSQLDRAKKVLSRALRGTDR